MSQEKRTKAFGDLIYAAMLDAALERKMTQFKTEITPEGKTYPIQIRIIVIPEIMDVERPEGFQ